MLKPTVQIHDKGDVLVAEFWDCLRLDPTPIQELRKRFEAHLTGGGRMELVVDLSGVGFAGSAALGGFLALRRAGARLIFCNVDPMVREVFIVSKIESLFTFVGDRPAALALAERGEAVGAEAPPAPAAAPPQPAPPPLRRGRGRAP